MRITPFELFLCFFLGGGLKGAVKVVDTLCIAHYVLFCFVFIWDVEVAHFFLGGIFNILYYLKREGRNLTKKIKN